MLGGDGGVGGGGGGGDRETHRTAPATRGKDSRILSSRSVTRCRLRFSLSRDDGRKGEAKSHGPKERGPM
jgi:hypothetical protein